MRRPRSWLAILLRLLLVAGVLAVPTLTQQVQGQGQGQGQEALSPFIRGRGLGYGWSIDIQGPSGTFQADGPTWRVELIFQQENSVRSSPYTLWFLGRKPDNFIMLYIDLDHQSGDTFFVHYYNYREGSYRVEQFSGGYDLSGFSTSTSTSAQAGPSPTFMAGYAPRGEIPDYEGRDFLIDSEYTHLTPEGGRVTYEDELYLAVYPVFYAAVTPSWREVWAIAVEPSSRHVYFLIFYTITPNAWVLDLWSGELRLLPLGQVVITGDLITVSRDARL